MRSPRRRLLRRLIIRDKGRCRYCLVRVVTGPRPSGHRPGNAATIEHYPVPKCRLPKSQWCSDEHVILACDDCNKRAERTTLIPFPIEEVPDGPGA